MKTMPRPLLRAMYVIVEILRTVIRRWEGKYADHADYRMMQLNSGLHQASKSLREIRAGHFEPVCRQTRWPVLEEAVLGERYASELLGDAPIPLRPSEN